MNKTELRSLIREEVRKIINTKKTVKTSLQEGYSWERIPGKPLPTLEDVQTAHQNKKKLENYHNNDLQSTQKGKYDLQTEESEDDDWYGTKEKGEKDLDSSKGGTDNSLNAIHSSLLKIQKSMDALLSDYKSGKITKDVYIAKRKPLQAKRNKLEAAL